MKKINKYWIINFLAAAVLLGIGITMAIKGTTTLGNPGEWQPNLASIALGVVIGIVIYLFISKDIIKKPNGTLKTMKIVEVTVLAIIALAGLLLPGFDVYTTGKLTHTFWLGLAVLMHGVLENVTSVLIHNNFSIYRVMIGSAMVALGSLMLFSPALSTKINSTIDDIIIYTFIIIGGVLLILAIVGLVNFINRRKKKTT